MMICIDGYFVYGLSHVIIGIILAFKWTEDYYPDPYERTESSKWFICILFGWLAFLIFTFKFVLIKKWDNE